MIDAIEARNYVNEYMNNYSFNAACNDVNNKITALAKEGKSYLSYNIGDMRLGIADELVKKLESLGYFVVDNGYSIEINW